MTFKINSTNWWKPSKVSKLKWNFYSMIVKRRKKVCKQKFFNSKVCKTTWNQSKTHLICTPNRTMKFFQLRMESGQICNSLHKLYLRSKKMFMTLNKINYNLQRKSESLRFLWLQQSKKEMKKCPSSKKWLCGNSKLMLSTRFT